jgi:hypothetical protein
MHGGTPAVRDIVRAQAADWQWWDNPRIKRPLVSLVALTPDDQFEAARPERGVLLRVRCAWTNTTQGLPKKPIAEFVKLLVDDQPVEARLVTRRREKGGLQDYYHQYHLPAPAAGPHRAKAVVRVLETGQEVARTVNFTV